MNGLALSVASGFGLGLASTIHCAGMCGAIASGLMLAGGPCSAREAARTSLLMHLGRLTAYAAAGIAVGAAGAPAVGLLDREIAYRLVQWAGAAALLWIGLSTAGLLPPISVLDRLIAPVAGRLVHPAYANPTVAVLAGGFAWGLMPCAMVYGALFTALLAGSALNGAAVMLAFGTGTLPGLLASAFGIRALANSGRQRSFRMAAGLAIALFALSTVWVQPYTRDLLCRTGTTGLSAINGSASNTR